MPTPIQTFKADALAELPDEAGVYALCDLDEVPIYVGKAAQSRDTSLRKRVQRHLTSARSDVIANRQIDVWEVAFVWAWQVDDAAQRTKLESHLFHDFNVKSRLMNGSIPHRPETRLKQLPKKLRIQVMENSVVLARKDPSLRFPRQIQHCGALVDYILNTQDKRHLRVALDVHFERLMKYQKAFLTPAAPLERQSEDDDESDE